MVVFKLNTMAKINENIEVGNTGKTLGYAVDKHLELVAEVRATERTQKLELTNLNLGFGEYKIFVDEYSDTTTSTGHFLTINEIRSGYSTQCIHSAGGNNLDCFAHPYTLLLTNGWNAGAALFFTSADLHYFDQGWLGCEAITSGPSLLAIQSGYLAYQNVTRINSIEIVTTDGDYIGAGSKIKLYKVI